MADAFAAPFRGMPASTGAKKTRHFTCIVQVKEPYCLLVKTAGHEGGWLPKANTPAGTAATKRNSGEEAS